MLVTPMLHQGGFERICVLTAKLLKDRYDVYLAVFNTQDIFYDVEGLQLIDLRLGAARGSLGKLANICRRVRRLRQLKKNCASISATALARRRTLPMCCQRAGTSPGRGYAATAR